MTANLPLAEASDGHGLHADVPDAEAPPVCGATCGCRQRLTDAIADVPPRRHELEVLRLYLDKQQSES